MEPVLITPSSARLALSPTADERRAAPRKPATQTAKSVSRRGELHRPLLYGVLLLLIVESVMAWLFGHHAPRNA